MSEPREITIDENGNPEHWTDDDSTDCWCCPEIHYAGDTRIIVHNDKEDAH